MDGLSTYPFPVMGGAWAAHLDLLAGLPTRGDTKIGNDVWLGCRTLVLPGVSIGNGAIVGAGAVVSTNIPDYAIAAGNPAQIVRMRFDARTIARLLDIAWWDWPADRVTANIRALMAGDIAALEAAAP
jgi:virginiamycin A acetyltransferase